MSIDASELHALPVAEKLHLVDLWWDDIGSAEVPIPLPDWVEAEAIRRRDELRSDPSKDLTHEEVWRRIDGRNV